MATTRTHKVQAEIDKAKAKLAEQQARIKELEAKHTELENMEIVDIVRGLKIPLDGLAAALQSIKGGAAPATSGRIGPRTKTGTSDNQIIPENDNTEKGDNDE